MNHSLRGFSLIELLVVIAIMGILSSVVLGSVNIARDKGRDAAIKENMMTLSAQATVYDDQQGTYGTSVGNDCAVGVFTDTTVARVLAATAVLNGGIAPTCFADGSSYVVAATRPTSSLFTPDHPYWCVDNTGAKCAVDVLPTQGGACSCAP